MISCELVGRLGNQMFIIATAYSLAIDNEDTPVFPRTIGGITPTTRETFIHRETILRNIEYTDDLSFVKNVYREPPDFSYAPIEYKENMYLIGYFQSEKHFKHNRQKILDLFKPQEQIERYLSKKYSNLIENDKCVSIHIRRGDYLNLSDYHAILGERYYKEAMQRFPDDHTFVFFSDDVEWCRQEFNASNCVFIENQDDVLDMLLMSKITNNIIANSSFSWWGAWLNENKEKNVITPQNWFGPKNQHMKRDNITPQEWIVI